MLGGEERASQATMAVAHDHQPFQYRPVASCTVSQTATRRALLPFLLLTRCCCCCCCCSSSLGGASEHADGDQSLPGYLGDRCLLRALGLFFRPRTRYALRFVRLSLNVGLPPRTGWNPAVKVLVSCQANGSDSGQNGVSPRGLANRRFAGIDDTNNKVLEISACSASILIQFFSIS